MLTKVSTCLALLLYSYKNPENLGVLKHPQAPRWFGLAIYLWWLSILTLEALFVVKSYKSIVSVFVYIAQIVRMVD